VTEQLEAVDLSSRHRDPNKTKPESKDSLNQTPDQIVMDGKNLVQVGKEKDSLDAGHLVVCKPEPGEDNGMNSMKQQPVKRKLRRRQRIDNARKNDGGVVREKTNKDALQCPELCCNRQFKTEIRLLIHRQVHHFLKSLGGQFSDGSLSSLVTLQAVKKSDLSTDVVMWYKCPDQTCAKCFKSVGM